MTKAEQLAAQIERDKQALAKRQARLRALDRKATDKRRYLVGALADDAGLLGWSDTELVGVFAALAKLREMESPAAVLEALVGDPHASAVVLGNGVAESATRVSAPH